MHEWSLAEAVIFSAIEHKKKNKIKRITEISVSLGELQQIDREIFELALKEIALSRGMEPDIRIETEKALLRCRSCGKRWEYEGSSGKTGKDEAELIHFVPEVVHAYLRCPGCGSPDFEIIKGRGVRVDSMKGVG